MLTSVARPAEQRLSRTQMFGVSRRILLGIAVLSGPAGASIRKAHIFPVDELASIGLEPVYPHLCEIVSLGNQVSSAAGLVKSGIMEPANQYLRDV